MWAFVSLILALGFSATASAEEPKSVSNVVGFPYLGGYEPTIAGSLDDIPAPVREKLVGHLKKRLGDSFYSSLRFYAVQVVDFAEYHRQVPTWRECRWEVFAYSLYFGFSLPEKGIEFYLANVRLRADGSVIEEIDLPDMGKHPERASFIPLTSAIKIAADAGFDVSKCNVEIDYRPKDDCCAYFFRQLDRTELDGLKLHFKCIEIDAHSGKQLRVFTQEAKH